MKTGRHARQKRSWKQRAQAGSTAVEMALVLPVILSMLFGILEIGNIVRIQITMQSAVTAIAHDAAMHETTQTSAEQFMNDNGLIPGVQQSTSGSAPALTLTPPATTSCKVTPCTPFEVKLTYNYQAMTDLMKPFFDNIPLTASARKMSERW